MKKITLFTVMMCLTMPLFVRNTNRSVIKDRVRISKAFIPAASGTDGQNVFCALILWSLTLWFIFDCVTAYGDIGENRLRGTARIP